MKTSWSGAFLMFLTLVTAVPAAAQNPAVRDTMPIPDSVVVDPPAPRGAFVRAVLVPGWGHLYLGEYRRAGVYMALESASWFMLIKTMSRLSDVTDRRDRLTEEGEELLRAEMAADTARARELSDPEAFEAALAEHPGLANARSLTRAREQQRQDWITYTLFFTFASAVDAYVTAHLKDFPGEIMTAAPPGGGLSMGLRLPVGASRR